jgi:PleD family two-component response regulator
VPTNTPTTIKTAPTNHGIYVAVRSAAERSHVEDSLVLDGFNISTFASAKSLWAAFEQRPTRFVITERRFGDDFSGIDLCKNIRRDFLLPYVYVVILSSLSQMKQIKEALSVGVDDYLIKPANPFQLRTRALVGKRWLAYIDSLYAPKEKKAS